MTRFAPKGKQPSPKIRRKKAPMDRTRLKKAPISRKFRNSSQRRNRTGTTR